MLLTRILAALVFTPALLAVVWLGGAYLAGACLLIATLSAWELFRMTLASDAQARAVGLVLAVLVAVATLGLLPLGERLAAIVIIAALTAVLFRPDPIEGAATRAGLLALGALYTGGLITYLARLRELELGLGLALLALLCTFGADTGAYFAGKLLGRHKLYPKISPGKTVEGAVGAVLSAIAAAFAVHAFFPTGFGALELSAAGLVIAVFGAIGDLCESMLKRSVGAKDSSRLIPGHGGVLDRFDALFFAAPAVYFLALWTG